MLIYLLGDLQVCSATNATNPCPHVLLSSGPQDRIWFLLRGAGGEMKDIGVTSVGVSSAV